MTEPQTRHPIRQADHYTPALRSVYAALAALADVPPDKRLAEHESMIERLTEAGAPISDSAIFDAAVGGDSAALRRLAEATGRATDVDHGQWFIDLAEDLLPLVDRGVDMPMPYFDDVARMNVSRDVRGQIERAYAACYKAAAEARRDARGGCPWTPESEAERYAAPAEAETVDTAGGVDA